MKIHLTLLSFLATASISQAALFINAGASASSGQGPSGTNSNYLGYSTPHESATSGIEQIYTGVTFAEGGLTGTYNVGVSFVWNDATTDASKQSFSRANVNSYTSFFTTWVGIDVRTANGGIGGGDSLTLKLNGLEANTAYVFTSYHFDTHDQAGTFSVDQTPTSSETASSPFSFPSGGSTAGLNPAVDNAYSFDVTSDSSGNLDITYTQVSGTWIGINGFDLEAVPEPSSAAILCVGLFAGSFRRRR